MAAGVVAGVVALYASLACATVVPPPGTAVQPKPTPTTKATLPAPPPKPGQLPAWDLLGTCSALNERGVQTYPSLNPPPYN